MWMGLSAVSRQHWMINVNISFLDEVFGDVEDLWLSGRLADGVEGEKRIVRNGQRAVNIPKISVFFYISPR